MFGTVEYSIRNFANSALNAENVGKKKLEEGESDNQYVVATILNYAFYLSCSDGELP